MDRQQTSFEETLAGLVPPVESKPSANRSRFMCKRRHAEYVVDTSPHLKQKRSNAQIQAIVQMVLPKQRPASYVSIVASKNGHDSETLDFWAQSKPIYNHQDTSLDFFHPQIIHDESAFDSIWCRWRLNSTRQPNPVLVMDRHSPSLAEAAEAFRRSRRNSKTSLPSSSSTNHAATITMVRRLKSRDVMVHSWTGEDFDYIVYFQDDRSQGTKSGSNSENRENSS